MRKVTIAGFAFFTLCITSIAQNNDETFFVYKNDWTPARSYDRATYFMQAIKVNDTTYCCRYYQKNGPIIKQECYKDSKLTIPNGLFVWYNKYGKIDSCGIIAGQQREGIWRYYDDDLNAMVLKKYRDGILIETRDSHNKKIYYPDGRITIMDSSTGNSQESARCKDGPGAWAHYIATNVHIPDRFQKLGNSGTVVISFDVDPQGNFDQIIIAQSIEWSADAEAIRVIKEGPQWLPGKENGQPVRYTQKQSITMRVN